MNTAWAEITSLEHGHGGEGWELGRCLWSPSIAKNGTDRYGVMRLPAAGDDVFHMVAGVSVSEPKQRVLYGSSQVAESATTQRVEPPSPGIWQGAGGYFRIELENFREASPKHLMEVIEAGLGEIILSDLLLRPKYYLYSTYRDGFRGAQGIYIAKLTTALAAAFRLVLRGKISTDAVHASSQQTEALLLEFAEGERSLREYQFFRRNPALRAAAIERYGLSCVTCGLRYEDVYGALGEGYIEIHHLNPLSERVDTMHDSLTTKIEDVVPLCANCHRMIHRRRPALSLDALRHFLSARVQTVRENG